jgi:hypothetical protein
LPLLHVLGITETVLVRVFLEGVCLVLHDLVVVCTSR